MSILCSLVHKEWNVVPIDTVDSEMKNLYFYEHTSLIVQINKFFSFFNFVLGVPDLLVCPHIIGALSRIFQLSALCFTAIFTYPRFWGLFFVVVSFVQLFLLFLFSILESRPRLTRERALDPGMSCFYFMILPVFSLHFVFVIY